MCRQNQSYFRLGKAILHKTKSEYPQYIKTNNHKNARPHSSSFLRANKKTLGGGGIRPPPMVNRVKRLKTRLKIISYVPFLTKMVDTRT